RGEIDGVEQLTRYLELLNRDPLLAPVRGVFAAQAIKPQARVLATDRGIDCVTLDYDALRGIDDAESRLFCAHRGPVPRPPAPGEDMSTAPAPHSPAADAELAVRATAVLEHGGVPGGLARGPRGGPLWAG